MADLDFKIRLTADGSGYVGQVRIAREETEKLGNAGRAASGGVQQLDTEMKKSQASAVALGAAIGFVGVQAALGLGRWAAGSITAAAALKDLSSITGSTVEDLSHLTNVARVSGFDGLNTALERLAVGLSGTDEGSKRAGKALAALGITSRDPAQAMTEIAKKLSGYADDANKAAYANEIFGRGGAKLLPFLKDLAEQQGNVGTVTRRQAEEADNLARSTRELGRETDTLLNAFLSGVVPTIGKYVKLIIDAREQTDGWIAALRLAANINPGKSTVENLAETRAELEKLRAQYIASGEGAKGFINNTLMGGAGNLGRPNPNEMIRLAQTVNLLESELEKQIGIGAGGGGASIGPVPGGGGRGRAEVDEFAKALGQVNKIAAEADLQLAGVFNPDEITRANKALTDLAASPAWTKIPQAQQEILKGILAGASATELEARAQKKAIAADIDGAEAMLKLRDAFKSAEAERKNIVDSYRQANEDLARENALIGQSELAHQLLNAELENEATIRRLGADASKETIQQLEDELVVRKQLITEGFDRKAFVDSVKEQEKVYKETYESIRDGITDTLLDAWANGKSGAKALVNELKNMFANLVLRPVIQAAVAPLAGGIASLVSGGAQASGGGAGLGGLLNLGGSAASGLSKLFGGSDFTAALAGDAYLPAALGAAGEGAASIGSILGGLGGLGGAGLALAAAPIAIGFIKKLFGKKKKKKAPVAAAPAPEDPAEALGQAMASVTEALDGGAIRDAQKQWDASQLSSVEKLRTMGSGMVELAGKLDGSAASAKALAAATTEYSKAAADSIFAIRGLQQSLSAMFAATREQVEFAGLDKQASYDLYKSKGSALLEVLSGTEDPAVVDQMAQKINSFFLSAFNLLDPTEQLAHKQEFLDSLNNVDTLTNERLNTIAGTIQADSEGPFKVVQDALTKATSGMTAAGDKQQTAADAMIAAAAAMQQAVKDFGESTIGISVEPGYSAVGGP